MINSRKGFTLIEFLVAIVILMVGLLGLLQTVNLAIVTNLENILRTDAVMLADERLMEQRAKTFNAISTNNRITYISRTTRGGFNNYSVRTTGTVVTTTDLGEPRSKQVDINVSWRAKGKRFVHSVSSIISTFPQ
jgi:type IV pilus assembly protein PilV